MRKVGSLVVRALVALALAATGAWSALALLLGPPDAPFFAALLAATGAAAALSVLVRSRPRLTLWTSALFAVALAAFAVRWSAVEPSNDRDWQNDVAVLTTADIDGDRVTIHNIRDLEYRSETDYTPRYYDKTFDLRELDSADLIASYWMGDAIAHIFVSFGFAGKDYLAISIETRKEKGEEYSTVAGFFRQYEILDVVADERDLIGVRTNIRNNPPEDVYLYRTRTPPDRVRRLFLDYLREINALAAHPEFYNTATTNCTTGILAHSHVNTTANRYSWKIALSGYAPLYVYEKGGLDDSMPFEELRRRSRINEAARAGGLGGGFSQRIRAGVPDPRDGAVAVRALP
ncbi:MAG: DUF4105 domain-containing protein [Deltaproteobacteria bacterium]|nr:DUF4105 domain-containing protein [Deltaproteobacteria bacterium]